MLNTSVAPHPSEGPVKPKSVGFKTHFNIKTIINVPLVALYELFGLVRSENAAVICHQAYCVTGPGYSYCFEAHCLHGARVGLGMRLYIYKPPGVVSTSTSNYIELN